MDNILDSTWFTNQKRCSKKFCPIDEELIKYPMLDEDIFDRVDECIYRCQTCKKRQDALDGSLN